eukprot:3911276-Heterocapsa_arctica.AAC.1
MFASSSWAARSASHHLSTNSLMAFLSMFASCSYFLAYLINDLFDVDRLLHNLFVALQQVEGQGNQTGLIQTQDSLVQTKMA